MNSDTACPTEENIIRIDTPRDLHAGLRAPDPASRASLLRAIRNDPGTALSFGPVAGRDVVDELLLLCEESNGTAERWEYVYTALSLVDARTADLAKNEFLATHDHRYLVMAARRLSHLPEPEMIHFLSPIVMESREVNRCRLGANVLAGNSGLDARLAIRVAALADRSCVLPPLDRETLEFWIAELVGPYPQKVRALLETMNNGVQTLLSYWYQLPEKVASWALARGVEEGVEEAGELLRKIITSHGDGQLLLAALNCLRNLPAEHRDDAQLKPLYAHPDPAVRAAAIRAGVGDMNPAPFVEDVEEVRVAFVDRLDSYDGTRAIEPLVSLLGDRSWRVRARAVDVLVRLAPASLDHLRETLSCSCEEARIAAVKALLVLGKESWVKYEV